MAGRPGRAGRSGAVLLPFPGPARGSEASTTPEGVTAARRTEDGEDGEDAERGAALEQVLATARSRWGPGALSLVRLDRAAASRLQAATGSDRAFGAAGRAQRQRERALPSWWPVAAPGGVVARPRLLEFLGEAGSGRLSLALAWMAAAQPALAAVVDCAGAGRFYPPAAASAGMAVERTVIIRPPGGEPRAALDAVVALVRSEAFDVVLCPLPAAARISLAFGGKLATLAARSGTTVLLLTTCSGSVNGYAGLEARSAAMRARFGALGAFAEYRVRLAGRRWLWEDGEIAGMKLRVATERARATAGHALGSAGGLAGPESTGEGRVTLEHELTLRLHREVRHGGYGGYGTNQQPAKPATPDLLYLARSVRLEAGQAAGSAADGDIRGGDVADISDAADATGWRLAR